MHSSIRSISETNISFLKKQGKSPKQVADFFREGAKFWNFADMLGQFYEGDLKEALTEGLAELNGDGREMTARKVRNWMNGKNLPKNRETVFQICFVLKLDEKESGRVLGMLSDTGIHYRNPEELAYAYALKNKMTYQEALSIKEKAVSIYESVNAKNKKGEEMPRKAAGVYTRQIQAWFDRVETEEEFFEFIKEHGRELGRLHETAYQKFIELLDILQNPKGAGGDENKPERDLTLEEVMEEYLRMHVPEQKRKCGGSDAVSQKLSPLQKLVKKCWPNETELVRMRNRKEDVSRKTLLLLYLVTEAFDMAYEKEEEYYVLEDLEEDADMMLEIRKKRMDLFLDAYGMNRLDAGNPFDFLILYAFHAQGDAYLWERMEQMMETLFV